MNDKRENKHNIVLIGFMGTGKSTVGKKLAARLRCAYLDTDAEVERVTGLTIPQIFDRFGEVRFRSEESLVAQKVAAMERTIVSTGGGIVLNRANLEALGSTGILIRLNARPEVIWSRVARRTHRPLIKKDITPEDIEHMMAVREPYYGCADLDVDTSERTVPEIVEYILDFLNRREGEDWRPLPEETEEGKVNDENADDRKPADSTDDSDSRTG
ncbi:AAA family ATPase [Heliobacillus mobilis]|uniref:Shikimate kinase n=1 Tax=Heliobacterium mobile TaxID=28064 RepID=A0A6I3SKA6_HELMO|nr:shikimate kinase [Heliobacterium mobile]MTV49364.1 AAA family ATPase [Heliobacterium mobile]